MAEKKTPVKRQLSLKRLYDGIQDFAAPRDIDVTVLLSAVQDEWWKQERAK